MIRINVTADSLAFTYCQVPFVYHIAGHNEVRITHANGTLSKEGLEINASESNEIWNRTGVVRQVDVYLMPRLE